MVPPTCQQEMSKHNLRQEDEATYFAILLHKFIDDFVGLGDASNWEVTIWKIEVLRVNDDQGAVGRRHVLHNVERRGAFVKAEVCVWSWS